MLRGTPGPLPNTHMPLACRVGTPLTADTLPPPPENDRVHVVSVAPLLAAAVYNIHTNLSVTRIFRDKASLFEPQAEEA